MFRMLSILVLGAFFFGFVDSASAQKWPVYPSDIDGPHKLVRGTGGYFSPIKLGLVVVAYFLWVKFADWVNRDCQTLKMKHVVWNSAMFWPFLAGLFLVFLIPIFLGGFPILLLSLVIPLIAYVLARNGLVQPHDRVCTPAHLRYLLSQGAKSIGMKVAQEKKAAHEKGAPVTLTATEGSTHQKQANEINARQGEGFMGTKSLLADMIDQRSDKAMMDYNSSEVTVRFQIDGVWHESESQDRDSGDAVLAVLKTLANLKVAERKERQAGRFLSEYKKIKYKSTLVCQGTKTGERVILQLDGPIENFSNVTSLGMRQKMMEQLTEILAQENGMVIFSSTPGNGLSTTVSIALKLTDRYMRDFAALQEIRSPEPLAENIEATLWDQSKGDVPEKILQTLLRKDPDAIVVNEMPNSAIVNMLCENATAKLVITTVRAKEAVEALLRVLLLKVPANVFAPAVSAVVNQRLVRRLCEHCKEAYEPAPALLKKLGIPAGRIDNLYRPPDPAEQDKPCPECNGIGYKGRTAVFEILKIDAKMRDALIKQPKLEVLRQVAKTTGNRGLQQEGIVLVAQGITSLNELQRVLKQ